MPHPIVEITIDGVPVSDFFWSKLISVTVTDKEGFSSDTIDLEIEAGGPQFISLPRSKAVITCAMGIGVPVYMGTFEADAPELHCYPHVIKVTGKAIDIRGKAKEHDQRHWDDSDFGTVAGELAGEMGLSLQIDPRIAKFKGKDGYFAMEQESRLHFLERTSRRLGGVFTVKDGKALILDKGMGLTAGGAAIGGLIITPPMHIQGSMSVKFSEREQHKKVRASYYDDKAARQEFAEAEANPQGEADYTLRHRFANKEEAEEAAKSRAKALQRSADSTSVTIEGNSAARGGAPMSYLGFHPDVDGLPFVIESAAHTYVKGGGYTVAIQGNAPGTGGGES